jgi:hypothetical protein
MERENSRLEEVMVREKSRVTEEMIKGDSERERERERERELVKDVAFLSVE